MTPHETQSKGTSHAWRGAILESAGVVALTALIVAATAGVAFAAGGVKPQHHVASHADGLSRTLADLLVAFIGAVLGAFAAFAGRELRKAWRNHRGLLTGFWLWVRYERGDLTMSRPVFSVELLQVKHRLSAGGGKIRGTAWRVFADKERSAWDRRWTLIGWAKDKFVECVYTSETGGEDGVVNMWKTNPGYEGEYIQARKAAERGQPNDSIVTEWARLPRELPQRLKEAVARIPAEEAKRYPRRVRLALGLSKPLGAQLRQRLPFAAAPLDDQLAPQATSTSNAPEGEMERFVIHRCDLQLGEHSKPRRLQSIEPSIPGAERNVLVKIPTGHAV
jgi:hypothetical protein